MEESNTALLAAKLHHTSHMIKKFSHQAIHITCMKSLSDSSKKKKKKKKLRIFIPNATNQNFSQIKKKIFKVQTEKKKIKYDGSKYQIYIFNKIFERSFMEC